MRPLRWHMGPFASSRPISSKDQMQADKALRSPCATCARCWIRWRRAVLLEIYTLDCTLITGLRDATESRLALSGRVI